MIVLLPVAGKPVRHIDGGEGNEGGPSKEDREVNCGKRQG